MIEGVQKRVEAGGAEKHHAADAARSKPSARERIALRVHLVNSAGAQITDQVDLFPGRRGAGHIFHTHVRGSIPQASAPLGPSAAGETADFAARGAARVHRAESGVGHFLRTTEAETVRRYLPYPPSNWTQPAPVAAARSARPWKSSASRHGIKMITASSEATVPEICVVVHKASGASPTRWPVPASSPPPPSRCPPPRSP